MTEQVDWVTAFDETPWDQYAWVLNNPVDCVCVQEVANDAYLCFPADASARVEGRGAVAMADLKAGDMVLAEGLDGVARHEPLHSFAAPCSNLRGPMDCADGLQTYYTIETTTGRTLRATARHKVFTLEGACASAPAAAARAGASKRWAAVRQGLGVFATRADGAGRMAAEEVHAAFAAGSPVAVWTHDEAAGALVCDDVVATGVEIAAKGLYNPRTMSGSIVVDGVLAAAEYNYVPYVPAPNAVFDYVWHNHLKPALGLDKYTERTQSRQ